MARPLYEIADEIKHLWLKVNYGAKPYLEAMAQLCNIKDHFGYDKATEIVNYFLANATTWRGEDARRIKQELKDMVKEA